MMWSRFAVIGATLYLLVFACTAAYPLFDYRTFAGLPMVLLGLPWIDYLPSRWFPVSITLNALIIYFVLAALSFLFSLLLRRLRV
jgi:hypothetical protein